jgi:hypothetical protein
MTCQRRHPATPGIESSRNASEDEAIDARDTLGGEEHPDSPAACGAACGADIFIAIWGNRFCLIPSARAIDPHETHPRPPCLVREPVTGSADLRCDGLHAVRAIPLAGSSDGTTDGLPQCSPRLSFGCRHHRHHITWRSAGRVARAWPRNAPIVLAARSRADSAVIDQDFVAAVIHRELGRGNFRLTAFAIRGRLLNCITSRPPPVPLGGAWASRAGLETGKIREHQRFPARGRLVDVCRDAYAPPDTPSHRRTRPMVAQPPR